MNSQRFEDLSRRVLAVLQRSLLAGGLLLGIAPISSASAQDFTLVDVCPFPVAVDIVDDRTQPRPAAGRGGNPFRQVVTGRLTARLTNLTTRQSQLVNISGPTFTTTNPDGSSTVTLRGRALIALFPGEPQGPQLFVNSGQVVLGLNAAGSLTQISQTGHKENLCASLAG